MIFSFVCYHFSLPPIDYKTLIYDAITLLPFNRLDALCSKQ